MAFSSCFFSQTPLSFKASCSVHGSTLPWRTMIDQRLVVARKNLDTELFSQQRGQLGSDIKGSVSFFGKSAGLMQPNPARRLDCKRISRVSVSCLPSSQLASSVFGLGTAAVLPFYTLMIVAPKAEFTKKLMGSSLPYIALGLLYAYLLYLSWTPDTIQLMFSGKNWMPELPAIAKLFSGEMTLASAWIHLLAIDLFAARQVYHDGLQENVETRHSVSLCLLFCPIGVLTHFVTKALTKSMRQGIH